ncbi:MAG: hypothetical protein PHE49_11445 [bacterium]|nr:hypothetical protein [bacterium]
MKKFILPFLFLAVSSISGISSVFAEEEIVYDNDKPTYAVVYCPT